MKKKKTKNGVKNYCEKIAHESIVAWVVPICIQSTIDLTQSRMESAHNI